MILGAKRRSDGSWSTADPEGTGGAGSNEIIFQTDFNAASAVLNGFDSWNIVESYLESGLTTTITHDGSRAIFNLKGGSTLNDVYMGTAFGNHHTVGDAAVDELYLRFIWQASNLAAINHFNGGVHKIALIDFRDPTTGVRAFQLVLGTISDGTNMRFFVDQTVFNRTTGQWISSLPATAESTTTIAVDTDYYLKLRVLNSSAGATDGAVQLWINNVLECEDNAIALNDANSDSPNMIIFGSYNSSRGATQDGVMQYEDCTLSNYDLGAWVASPGLPTWTGYDDSTRTATATEMILDLSDDLSSVAPNLLRVTPPAGDTIYRMPVATHIPNGGLYGNGAMEFTPGNSDQAGGGLGQHYCGISFDLGAFNTAILSYGQLIKFDDNYTEFLLGHSAKQVIWNRSIGGRPMIVFKEGDDFSCTPCSIDGGIGNCTRDHTDRINYPPNNWEPNIRDMKDEWVWLAQTVNANTGWIYTYLWSVSGSFAGLATLTDMYDGGTGGVITDLDTTGFMNPLSDVQVGSYQMEIFRVRTDSDAVISPPDLFPIGHNASDWA